jgi:hypothetical protein
MTEQTSKTATEIKGMGNGQDGETIPSHEHAQNSGVVGDSSEAPAARPRKAVRGVLERRWRRKNDIYSLHGLIREHSRLIAAMHSGRIRLDMGEVLSRAYSRHREMVSALEQQTQLAAIQDQLRALRGDPSAQLLIDEDKNRGS